MKTIIVRRRQVIGGRVRAVGEIVAVPDNFEDPLTNTVAIDDPGARQKEIETIDREHQEIIAKLPPVIIKPPIKDPPKDPKDPIEDVPIVTLE